MNSDRRGTGVLHVPGGGRRRGGVVRSLGSAVRVSVQAVSIDIGGALSCDGAGTVVGCGRPRNPVVHGTVRRFAASVVKLANHAGGTYLPGLFFEVGRCRRERRPVIGIADNGHAFFQRSGGVIGDTIRGEDVWLNLSQFLRNSFFVEHIDVELLQVVCGTTRRRERGEADGEQISLHAREFFNTRRLSLSYAKG
jgi:hypothetical protein